MSPLLLRTHVVYCFFLSLRIGGEVENSWITNTEEHHSFLRCSSLILVGKMNHATFVFFASDSNL